MVKIINLLHVVCTVIVLIVASPAFGADSISGVSLNVQGSIDGLKSANRAVNEDEKERLIQTLVNMGKASIRSPAPAQAADGRIPASALAALLAFFIVIVHAARLFDATHTCITLSLHKYASRMVLITTAYLLLKEGDTFVAYTLKHVDFAWYRQLGEILINHLNGSNYQYFFTYFIDLYFLLSLLLLYPYLYYREAEVTLHEDKYSSLMMSCCSIGSRLRGTPIYWTYTSRLGLLTFCVKIFFVPFLISWVINNTFHQINISRSFTFDLALVNAWLVALFIYIDTTIFCCGYLFEFNFLKNEIKSVEPTLFGWLVCLWCYPPFNVYSYRIFDHKLIDMTHTYPSWVLAGMTCLITLMWGIFAWASLSLGWKASNLTNRGIIRSGPYRYVRHPAYSAKLFVFSIQGIFMGQHYLGLLIGFTIIYVLRAWTEERHLSNDPDYVEYKDLVRWRFIPGVI